MSSVLAQYCVAVVEMVKQSAKEMKYIVWCLQWDCEICTTVHSLHDWCHEVLFAYQNTWNKAPGHADLVKCVHDNYNNLWPF